MLLISILLGPLDPPLCSATAVPYHYSCIIMIVLRLSLRCRALHQQHRGIVDFTELLRGNDSRLLRLTKKGYIWKLTRPDVDANLPDFVIAASSAEAYALPSDSWVHHSFPITNNM